MSKCAFENCDAPASTSIKKNFFSKDHLYSKKYCTMHQVQIDNKGKTVIYESIKCKQDVKDSKIKELNNHINTLKSDNTSKDSKIKELNNHINTLKSDNTSKDSKIKELNNHINTLKSDNTSKEYELRAINMQLDSIKLEIKTIKDDKTVEITKTLSLLNDGIRKERTRFFSKDFIKISNDLKESQIDDTVAAEWLKELMNSYNESLELSYDLINTLKGAFIVSTNENKQF